MGKLKKSSHFITFQSLKSPKQISKTFIFHILWVMFHFPCCTKLFLSLKTLAATTILLQLYSSIAQNCFCYLKLWPQRQFHCSSTRPLHKTVSVTQNLKLKLYATIPRQLCTAQNCSPSISSLSSIIGT